MSVRSVLVWTSLSALLAVLVGCNKSGIPSAKTINATPSQGGSPTTASQPDDPNANVGEALYRAAPDPVIPQPNAASNDPIAIPCTVQYEDRQQLSAETDGKIELIATPFSRGKNGNWEYRLRDVAGKEEVIEYNPAKLHPAIVFLPLDEKKEVPHWKLVDGDRVSEGQILCVLDDQLWLSKKVAALAIMNASKDSLKSAQEGVRLAKQKVELDEKANKSGSGSIAALLDDQTTLERFIENQCQAIQSIAKAEGDLKEAEVNLRKHQIKTRVDGFIRSIIKRPGEFVHAGEKIMEIQSTEKVRLEGNLDVQFIDRIKRQMEVAVEPALPGTPAKSHAYHRAEVAGIAVTGHNSRPLVVSASMDSSAIIWDPNIRNEEGGLLATHSLPHPVGVRSVVCTPPGKSPVLVITGAEDGKVRIWDVTDRTRLPKTPTREPSDIHSSGIHAMAISPDGKFIATAAGREIFLWDVDAGKKLYALPQEHRDSVTSLAFSPQAQLVSVAKDNSLKVWKLGAEKAAVAKTVEHRSGAVDTLGITPDGGRVLFDQDKSRIDLITLTDAQTTGQITNVGPGITFSTLAIFSPDRSEPGTPADKLRPYFIATAGGEGDLKGGMQIWSMPRAGGRGSEIGRLMTPGHASVTCGGFSPNREQFFLAVGTERGTVHVWTPPKGPQERQLGRITNIEPSDPRFVTVRVEMPNKDLNLLDRSAATVIIDPSK